MAIAAKTTGAFMFSHETAALLHGLPLVGQGNVTHLFQNFRPGPRDAEDVRRRFLPVLPEHTTRHGLPVTSLERTLVDCAMSLGRRNGLVIADAALHAGADRELCEQIVASLAGRRGVVAARWVLDHSDDGSESPGESHTRFAVLLAGLDRPTTQIRIRTHLGEYWGDLGWPERRVLLEYDGQAKYEANGTAATAVLAEKRRQEAIEAAGWIVIRVTAADLADPTQLIRRIRAALRSRRPTTGS